MAVQVGYERSKGFDQHAPGANRGRGTAPLSPAEGLSLVGRLVQAGQSLFGKSQSQQSKNPSAAPTGAVMCRADAKHTPASTVSQADQVRLARERQARDPNASAEVLSVLAKDTDSGVRLALANNPHLPEQAFSLLQDDPDRMVRAALAAHPFAPAAVLVHLSTNSDKLVLLRLAQNPHTPADTLAALADKEDARIQAAVIANGTTPLHVVNSLISNSADDAVRHQAREAFHRRSGQPREFIVKLDMGR